jgi:hypothetical protein
MSRPIVQHLDRVATFFLNMLTGFALGESLSILPDSFDS